MRKGILLALLLAGCNSGGPPRPITWQDLKNPEPLKGKNVMLEGYPGVLVPATVDHKGEMSFFLMDQAVGVTSSAFNKVAVKLKAGEAPNQASPLPDNYKPEDLKVHCINGLATYKDKVRLTGWVEVMYGAPTLHPTRLEKIP